MTSGSAASTCQPVRAARDAVVHLALHQADDSRRQIGQGGEAPLASQPLVVAQDHERRHQRHEHQREQPCSHRRQERGDPIDDATRSPRLIRVSSSPLGLMS